MCLLAGEGKVGAQGDRSELQGPLSTVFWGKLVGFGLVFVWQEAPGIIFIHSFGDNAFYESVLRIPFA